MVIYQSTNTIFTISGPEVSCRHSVVDKETKSSTVSTVSTNSGKVYLKKIKQDETVNSEWRNNKKIPEGYKKYREAFLYMMKPFRALPDEHHGTTNTATYHIELTSTYIQRIHSTPYRTESKTGES